MSLDQQINEAIQKTPVSGISTAFRQLMVDGHEARAIARQILQSVPQGDRERIELSRAWLIQAIEVGNVQAELISIAAAGVLRTKPQQDIIIGGVQNWIASHPNRPPFETGPVQREDGSFTERDYTL